MTFLWHCFFNLNKPFALAKLTTNCSGNPIILYLLQSQLSIALTIEMFHCLSDPNIQLLWSSLAHSILTIHCFQKTDKPFASVILTINYFSNPTNSIAQSIPTFHCFSNPDVSFALAILNIDCFGNLIILLLMQSWLSIALAILTFHYFGIPNNYFGIPNNCFGNPNILLLLKSWLSLAQVSLMVITFTFLMITSLIIPPINCF